MQLGEIGDYIRSCDSESDVELSSDDEAEPVDHDVQLDFEDFSSDIEETDPVPVVDRDGWSDTTSPLVVEPFMEESGPSHTLEEGAEPFDYFSLIFEEQYFEFVR